jgi:hypothetical protein
VTPEDVLRAAVRRQKEVSRSGCFCWSTGLLAELPRTSLERQPNTTLQLPPAPPAFGYLFTNAFPWRGVHQPDVHRGAADETNRLFVVERAGRNHCHHQSRRAHPHCFPEPRWPGHHDERLRSRVHGLHPGYATNGYFYVFYNGLERPREIRQNRLHDILSRFTTSPPGANSALTNTELKLLHQYDRSGDPMPATSTLGRMAICI